ncbi:PE family protein [Nocardia sp. NPDC005998]|uniref:PE family protein n=1 Tax=Nocardia sp. NPDC005998 TaxID=3156894 RepID=UPI0033B0AC3C
MAGTDNFDGVYFDPAAARGAAAGLDGLAQRLEDELRAAEPPLTVAPAGADEVSLRAAQSMNGVTDSYTTSAAAGVQEIRKLAAALRAQAGHYEQIDSDSAAHVARSV